MIFALFPLVIWTGLAMSPAVASAFPLSSPSGRAAIRTYDHTFSCRYCCVLFLLVHVIMFLSSGFRKRMGAMITGRRPARGAKMNQISRRKLITTGLVAAVGAAGLAAAANSQALWTHPARWRRHLRARRNPDLCRATALDSPLPGARVPSHQISQLPSPTKSHPLGRRSSASTSRIYDWRLRSWHGMAARPASFSLARAQEPSPAAARSLIWRAKKDGPISPNGAAYPLPTF